MVDERGVPLSIVVSGGNRNDVIKLAEVLDAKVIAQLDDDNRVIENLCADAGYVGERAQQVMEAHDYVPHVRPRGEDVPDADKNPDYKPRRWIVEVAHSWFTRFRKLLVRYEKKAKNFLALHHLAATIITLRKIKLPNGFNIIYG